MPAEGLQFPTKVKLEDEPPVQLLSQWRQQKSDKAAPKEPPLVNVQEANAWNGLVASLQATQSKQGKLDAAKKQHRPKLPDGSWSGTVLWNNAWDDALRKEAARPQHVSAQAQPEELAVPDAPRASGVTLPVTAGKQLLHLKVPGTSAPHTSEQAQAAVKTVGLHPP